MEQDGGILGWMFHGGYKKFFLSREHTLVTDNQDQPANPYLPDKNGC